MARIRERGFSLVEVLVSILVLALGVLGAAGMQLTALRTTHRSALQSVALQLAAEMADKMRANDSQMKQPDGDNLFLAVDYRSATDKTPASPPQSCYAGDCDAQQLAKFDIHDWERRIRDELPDGRARICRDVTPWDPSAHAFKWSCDSGSGASLVIKVGWQQRGERGEASGAEFPPLVALTVEPYIK